MSPLVISVEGVDGSGKSTLCSQLREQYGPRAIRVVRIDPFLPEEVGRDGFEHWVQATPAEDVARALLHAASLRRRVVAQETTPVVLLDRGPRSVLASARAHLRQAGRILGAPLAPRAKDAVICLEGAPCPATTQNSPRYARYLELFAEEYLGVVRSSGLSLLTRRAARDTAESLVQLTFRAS